MIEIFETADGSVFEGIHLADGIGEHSEQILIQENDGQKYWLNENLGIDRYPAESF